MLGLPKKVSLISSILSSAFLVHPIPVYTWGVFSHFATLCFKSIMWLFGDDLWERANGWVQSLLVAVVPNFWNCLANECWAFKVYFKSLSSFFSLLPMVSFLPSCFTIRNKSQDRSLLPKGTVTFSFVITFISLCSYLFDDLKIAFVSYTSVLVAKLGMILCCYFLHLQKKQKF